MRRITQRAVSELDWQFADADTRYLTHSIHRYSGKFIPQIARTAIELLTSDGALILDPYCGSGTTMLEAALTGRRSIGIDLSPLAVLISRVKTTPVGYSRTSSEIQRVRERLAPVFEPQLGLWESRCSQPEGLEDTEPDFRISDPWYTKWFQAEALEQLVAIYREVVGIVDDDVRHIGLVAFSDILRKSSNAHSGYPNVMFDRNRGPVQPPWSSFIARFEEIARLVEGLPGFADSIQPIVLEGDATSLNLDAGSIDAVITHPPYIGSVPYAEYGSLSLKWLGCEPRDLDRRLTGGRRQTRDVVERFRAGFAGMLVESHRVLRKGGHLFMLVGSPTVSGKRIDLAEMSKELADAAGFGTVISAVREGMNRRANLMSQEDVLFFRKESG